MKKYLNTKLNWFLLLLTLLSTTAFSVVDIVLGRIDQFSWTWNGSFYIGTFVPPTPPNTNYYYAYRADIPWGPSTVNYVTNSVTNSMVGYWTFETTNYGGIYTGVGTATQPTFSVWDGSNDAIIGTAMWNSTNSGCYNFDGIDDSVVVISPNAFVATGGSMTVAAWIQNHGEGSPGTQQSRTIASLWAAADGVGAGRAWRLCVADYEESGTNKLLFQIRGTDGSYYSAFSASDWQLNTCASASFSNWTFVVGVYDSSIPSISLWSDCVQKTNIGCATRCTSPSIGMFGVLRPEDYTYPFSGRIGVPSIYSRNLSGLEITNLYNDSCTKYGKSKL